MNRILKFILFLVLIVAFEPNYAKGQTHLPNSDSIQVANTLNEFVVSFVNLDWGKFTNFFADDATAFFPPSANFPNRANNKEEIEKVFRGFFDHLKSQKPSPPYLTIEPKDLRIQMFNSIAIATFILDDPGMTGRRTIILEKRNGTWLIIHLHASGIAHS